MRVARYCMLSALFALGAAASAPAAAADKSFDRSTVAAAAKAMTLPCMARLDDGRLLLVWTPGGDGILAAFSDHGRDWSKPRQILSTGTGHDYDPSIVVSGKRVLVTSTNTDLSKGIAASVTTCVRSEDNGKTWCPLYRIPMNHRYTCGKCHHGLRLKSGVLLMGYSWDRRCEKGESLPTEGDMLLSAGVMISTDDGLTWKNGGDTGAAYDRLGSGAVAGTDEPAIVELAGGSVFMLMRTGTDHLYQARSVDEGRTWTDVKPSGFTGHNAPAALCRFRVGDRNGLLCVWDNAQTRHPLCAAASLDEGKTWSAPKDIAGPTDGRQASYPTCEQAADGTLVAAWQQETPAGWDVRSARFSLDWLLRP